MTGGDASAPVAHRTTIRDVAREAGVSIKTVSNVVNGKGSMRPETRAHVERVISDLGYAVNVSARSLKTGSSGLIGLAVFGFSQPFASQLAQRIIEHARERGYSVVIDTYRGGPGGGFPAIMAETRLLPADGWIYFASQPIEGLANGADQQVPFVVAGDWLTHGRADLVTMPNVDAARVATGKLLDAGRRRIALLGSPGGDLSVQVLRSAVEGTGDLRAKGYAQAFTDRGLEIRWDLLRTVQDLTYEEGVRAARSLLGGPEPHGGTGSVPTDGSVPADGSGSADAPERPDAMICLNDAVALGAIHEILARGLRVPEDVAVVGFDNVAEAAYSNPGLSTIDPHLDDYAKTCVDMLMERIGGYTGAARTYTTDFDLVERDSARF